MTAPLHVVNTAVGSDKDARTLASLIIEARLAACVQCLPIHSLYRWKGRVESAREILLLAKTRSTCVKPLMVFIRKHHPYKLPEILATPVSQALPAYRQWVMTETRFRTSQP